MEKFEIQEIDLIQAKIELFPTLSDFNAWVKETSQRVLTTPGVLKQFLESFYKEEGQVKLVWINLIDNSSIRAKFYIPAYTKTRQELGWNHVSANQLNELIIKGCYLIWGHILRQGDISVKSWAGNTKRFNYEKDFQGIAIEALYKSDERKFRFVWVTEQEYIFDFYLVEVCVKWGYLSITIGYDGLVSGKSEVVIWLQPLDDFYKKSYEKYRKREQTKNMI